MSNKKEPLMDADFFENNSDLGFSLDAFWGKDLFDEAHPSSEELCAFSAAYEKVTGVRSKLLLPRSTATPMDDEAEVSLDRGLLVQRVLQQLQRDRLVTLLQTHRGNGRTLARQIVAQTGQRAIWLDNPDKFNRILSGNPEMKNSSGSLLQDLLEKSSGRNVPVYIVPLHSGQGDRTVEQVAPKLRNLLSKHDDMKLIIIGGEELLRRQHLPDNSEAPLLPENSLVDVPDLTESELRCHVLARGLSEEAARLIYKQTGGHPWLVEMLLRHSAKDVQSIAASIQDAFLDSGRLNRHLADSQARKVINALLAHKAVAPLGDQQVRHDPNRYPESRMFFDGLLRPSCDGETEFRSLVIRSICEREFRKIIT